MSDATAEARCEALDAYLRASLEHHGPLGGPPASESGTRLTYLYFGEVQFARLWWIVSPHDEGAILRVTEGIMNRHPATPGWVRARKGALSWTIRVWDEETLLPREEELRDILGFAERILSRSSLTPTRKGI